MSAKIDYTKIIKVGDKNKNIVVIDIPFKNRRPNSEWAAWYVRIKCDCGKEQCIPCPNWVRKEYERCRSCQLIGSNNYAWNGYGEINGHIFCCIKESAKKRGLKYNVNKKYLWELFLEQNRKCALSGVPLQFTINKSELTASLDRIDGSIGYVKGNVRWVHKMVNIMKNGFNEKDFLRFCKLIYEYNRDRIQGEIENISNRRNA
jgi:hypothetical protein